MKTIEELEEEIEEEIEKCKNKIKYNEKCISDIEDDNNMLTRKTQIYMSQIEALTDKTTIPAF